MKSLSLLLLFTLIYPSMADGKKDDKPKEISKGVWSSYDRFKDQTLIYTEGVTVKAEASKWPFLAGLYFGYIFQGKERKAPVSDSDLFIVISPRAPGAWGGYWQKLGDNMTGGEKRVYFSPNAEVIAIVNDERIVFPRAVKDIGLTGAGQIKDEIAIAVTREQLNKFASAKGFEIKIDDVLLTISHRPAKVLQERLQRFIETTKQP